MTHSWLHGDSSHCRHYALICLSLSFPPLSHSGVQLGCLPSSPPPSLQGPDFVEPKLQKLTSWSWCSLPFLFVGLPVLPLWSARSELTLWERLPDAQTAGEIILLFLPLSGFFFFYLTFCVSRGLLFPLYCFSIYSAELQVYFDTERSESDPPEKDHLLKRRTSKGQHHRKMSLTDIRRPNDIRRSHEMQLIPTNLENISCNIAPGCPIKKAQRSPQPAPRPPLWRKRRNVVGVGVWALVASRDWL